MFTVTAMAADGDRLVVVVDAGELVDGTDPDAAALVAARLADPTLVRLTVTGPDVAPALEPDEVAAATVVEALARDERGATIVAVDGDLPAVLADDLDGLDDVVELDVLTY